MYNWITTRKVARTEGPNYPARAVQTNDLTVAKWIPVTAGLLACFVTGSRAKLDSRYYESPTYPVRATQTVDATVRTWIPTLDAEGQSFRTDVRPPLDVRRYEWAPESFDVVTRVDLQVRTWTPAFDAELQSYRVDQRPPLDVRRYDWAPDAFDLVTRVDAQVRSWMPVADGELAGFRTVSGPLLDVRTYRWSPDDASWIKATLTPSATVAQTVPAWRDEGTRTAGVPLLDVRRYEWAPEAFNLTRLVDAQVSTYAPVFDHGGRTSAASSDVRTTAPLFTSAVTIPSGPSTAQTAPAWTNQESSDRTPDRPRLDLFRTQSIPDIFGVPDDWITWVPLQFDGDRTLAAPTLDVRRYEWSSFGWISALIQPPATQAQLWPAILEGLNPNYRTADRARLDVRTYDWAPPFTWAQPVLDAILRTWIAVFDAELASTRTAARRQDPIVTEPQPAWIVTSVPVDATPAQQVPAWVQAAGLSFRTVARPSVDVRADYWAPEFTWVTRVTDSIIAKWLPIWVAEVGVRTPGRRLLDVRDLTSAPELAWQQAVFNFVTYVVSHAPVTSTSDGPLRTTSSGLLRVTSDGNLRSTT